MQVVQNFDRKSWRWRLELMGRRGDILPIRPWYRHPINALCFAFLFLVTPWEKVDTWVVVGGMLVAVWFFLTSLLYPDVIEPMSGYPLSTVIAILLSAIIAAISTGVVVVLVGEAIALLVLMAIVALVIREWCQRRFEWQDQSFFYRRDHLDVAYGAFAVGSFLFLVGPQGQTTGLHVIGVMLMLIAVQQFFHPLRFVADSLPSLWVGRTLCVLSFGCVGVRRSGSPA